MPSLGESLSPVSAESPAQASIAMTRNHPRFGGFIGSNKPLASLGAGVLALGTIFFRVSQDDDSAR